MPMTERFYSVNGQMMGYESGGVKKDFLTDHLGSITAEIDQTQTRTYDTRYSAYGRNNWSTGTGCGFGWVGSYGYRETGLFHMSHYVRARHYSYITGNWSTVDPLWPDESAYGYVGEGATRFTDPLGRRPERPGDGLERCKKKKPSECFACAEIWYRKNGLFNPRKSCDRANAWCGTNIKCGPLGIFPVPKSGGCSPGAIMDYAEQIHKISDKMAHCVAVCMYQRCFGLGFLSPIRWMLPKSWGGEDSVLDEAAESLRRSRSARSFRLFRFARRPRKRLRSSLLLASATRTRVKPTPAMLFALRPGAQQTA
jgi:RHS repeat-associated protein